MIISIQRITQVRDQFIYDFQCPGCKVPIFGKIIDSSCDECKLPFNGVVVEISSKYERNLVAGSKRKLKLVTKRRVQRMYTEQEGRCAYCFQSLEHSYHVDHIVPLAVGGTNLDSNLALCCPRCNLLAGSRVFSSFSCKQKYVMSRVFPR